MNINDVCHFVYEMNNRIHSIDWGRDEQHPNKLINVNFVYDMTSYVYNKCK